MQKPPSNLFEFLMTFNDFLAYFFMAAMGSWGATVKYLESLNSHKPFRWIDVHISLFIGAFIGIVVGITMEYLNAPRPIIYATIGIAGNMGTLSLKLLANNTAAIPFKMRDGDKNDKDDTK